MFQIIGAMAEFERALIQERVKAGCAMLVQKASAWADRKQTWTDAPFSACGNRVPRGGLSPNKLNIPAAKNSRMVAAFVSRIDSITNLPVESNTGTEIVA